MSDKHPPCADCGHPRTEHSSTPSAVCLHAERDANGKHAGYCPCQQYRKPVAELGPEGESRRIADVDWRADVQHAARDLLGSQSERAARAADWEPGDFVMSLLAAMFRADGTNLALLGIGFPAYAHVVHVWKNTPGGYERVHALAGWEPQ